MKAGASSMWASCCGLLNEVMGTGAVRGQQPGFGAGAGPFRFAPSAGYSTYPPTSSGSPSLVCKACGQAFSVFRRKHICCDCKKSFCMLCTVLQENLRICATCHLLKGTAFQRPQLMRLRVKDLRQYLLLRNVPTDTCREKEDLVDLVLCHQGAEGDEDDPDTASLNSHPLYTPPISVARSASELSALSVSPSPGEALSRSDSSGTTHQDVGDTTSLSLLNLEPSDHTPEVSPQTRQRARASLSDISSLRDIEDLSVRQLKEILARNFVNYSGCCEKWELVERVSRLYRETEQNRKSLENVNTAITAVVALPPPSLWNGGIRGEVSEKGECSLGDLVTCTVSSHRPESSLPTHAEHHLPASGTTPSAAVHSIVVALCLIHTSCTCMSCV
ncbi:E3 ubiquitin-protein ligase RNF34a isoform X2 [Esox lucius]|uniref:E3 ubiquitin-protein ligase RNF34a isoform X2 n=1 Tax=Esox lucius TaxID=8010 RepID=UPI001476AE7C|nr:E3 ubiquitin-protein ligase RNF34a isoform X2 [Esox lucius]